MTKLTRNTLFFACIGLLPGVLGACPSADDVGEDETGETDMGDGDGDPGDGDPGDGDGDPGDGDGDPGDGDGDPGDGDSAEAACMTTCATIDSCDAAPKVPMCVEECVVMHEELADKPKCLDAMFALTVCVGSLDCAELEEYYTSEDPPYPCIEEEQALCGQFG
ncbi:hypothetical protein [Enhygromyxa salina]|uniref:Uncharacterized protein n=1 Tax=Enhygromyxa salina TaxID=215803 RepID=A0A2S9YFF9_9BACT|nr:hypothetical protein [Enhygromyxa salina]PRQ03772.1 hypothetical protein ENSA7_52390 [Enhygromyxa salina]